MKVHIVLACSEESQTKQIVPCLEEQGWQVTTAETGAEAFTQTEQILPQAVIVYASLSDITGWDVIEKVRENPATCETPVVLVYAVEAGDQDIFRAWRLGVDCSLRQPVIPQELVSLVSMMLRTIEGEESPFHI